jgi:hypothetical protein
VLVTATLVPYGSSEGVPTSSYNSKCHPLVEEERLPSPMVCLGETRLNLDTESKSSKFQFAVDCRDDTAIIQYPERLCSWWSNSGTGAVQLLISALMFFSLTWNRYISSIYAHRFAHLHYDYVVLVTETEGSSGTLHDWLQHNHFTTIITVALHQEDKPPSPSINRQRYHISLYVLMYSIRGIDFGGFYAMKK